MTSLVKTSPCGRNARERSRIAAGLGSLYRTARRLTTRNVRRKEIRRRALFPTGAAFLEEISRDDFAAATGRQGGEHRRRRVRQEVDRAVGEDPVGAARV